MTQTAEVTSSLVGWLENRKAPTMVFTEVALAGSWGSAGRLDVVAFTFGANHSATIDGFEVKVSRADFQKAVETLQLDQYLPSVDRMWFAVPTGLVRKEEVPPGIGLMTMSAGGRWQTLTRADHAPREDTAQMVRLLRRIHSDRTARSVAAADPDVVTAERILRMFRRAQDLHRADRLYGWWLDRAVKDRIADLGRAEERAASLNADAERAIANARRQADKIMQDAKERAHDVYEVGPTVALAREVAALLLHTLQGSGPAARSGAGVPGLSPTEMQSVMDALTEAKASARRRQQQRHES